MRILSLNQISKKYNQAKEFAVNDVSFDVEEGEILALIGESGSGKTTVLRLIAGLEHPDAGSISLSGQVIVEGKKSVPAHERQVGMVFQDYALFPHLTILENVKFGLKKNLSDPIKVAEDTLKLVGLREDYHKYPHQLSGGQQQRVALARAIAPNPKILLMDEPFSNLDAMLKDQVREEIRQIIKKTGITAIFVTHDTKDALSTADRIAILHKGYLQQIDIPKNLYEFPVNPYVANFFGKRNEIMAVPREDGFHTTFGFITDPEAKKYKEKVRLMFRPEHGEVVRRDGQQLSGKIVKISYFGSHQMVKLADEEGKRVTIRTNPGRSFDGMERAFFYLWKYDVEEAF
ncbi:putative ABC transporter ATP-binding protein [Indibacter alkaliphilus LW1]|jgi:iron(III) transport system ATP-binding protein|uniref:ABC transporter ATP-binding protein n=1 Tax=Indibacter alkaliphilus (strain CCUG 57479 / KCTC 22604 / LW1) TaxID=1189612 RepID=S2CXS0_INDAL|nr:ABC transporter ATP-binding protein [Indibacter alkaliphilus]EOZ91967.1 putative ABC transporter ATP-binding protein [Indibacter alkaliphilus LW1]